MVTWLKKSKEGMAKALCAIFGLSWNGQEALSFLRYAYDEDDPSPKPGRDVNVCYIAMNVTDDAATAWASTEWNDGEATVQKTIPLSCLLSFYGPQCQENAELAWTGIMLDTGFDSPRAILRDYSLVPVTRPPRPAPLNEEDGGMWRMRADLRIRLNLLHSDSYAFQTVETPPDVEITRSGDQK